MALPLNTMGLHSHSFIEALHNGFPVLWVYILILLLRLCTNSTWCFSHHWFFLYYRVLGHLAQRQGCLPYSQYLLQSPFLLLVLLVFVSFYCYIADRSVWEVQSETIFLYFGGMSQLQQNMRSLKTKITKVACPWVCKNPSPSSDVHVSYQGLQLSYIFCSSL